jgi:hypothetical protein
MSSEPSTSCPLCLKNAPIIGTLDFGRHKVFGCEGCGEFAVSDRADARIRGLPNEFKDQWRKKIEATNAEELFAITVSPVGDSLLM